MEVGDLVQTRPDANWGGDGPEYGIIVDIVAHELADDEAADVDIYAVVFWNEKFPAEEEYMEHLEVVNEAR